VLAGWTVLRFTWEQITKQPEAVVAAVALAVAQRAS
jgi:very-short-patch-repair endonuclease